MDALNSLTIEQLEQFNTTPRTQAKQKPFSLVKLFELVKSNLHRLDLYWELIIAHFICVVSSRHQQLIQDTAETLCQIIFMAFEYLLQYRRGKDQDAFIKDKWREENGTY
jgi:hypothetical protein